MTRTTPRPSPARPHPRATPALTAAVLAVGLVTATAVAPTASATDDPRPDDGGPTATVQVRELADVVRADGSLRRTEEWVVRRGTSVAGATGATAATGSVGGSGASAATGAGTTGGTMGRVLWFVDGLALATVEEPTGEPSGEPSGEPTGEPTGEPSGDPSGEPSGDPSDEPSGEPSGTPSGEPSGDPTAQPTTQPSGQPTPQPTGQPGGGGSGAPGGAPAGASPGQGPAGGAGAAPGAPGGSGGLGGLAPTGSGAPEGGAPAGGATDGSPVVDDPVLTAVAAPGTEVVAGSELFALDAEPVVALVGDWVPWRDLGADTTDGPDVEALEQVLVDLGHGDGLTVDQEADDATAAAIKSWETDLGRVDPDGVLQPSDVVVVPAGTVVTDTTAVLGQQVSDGAEVLALGSPSLEAVVDVAAEAADGWAVGALATVELPDERVVTGAVRSVGRDLVDGQVEVVLDLQAAEGSRSGLPVEVVLDGEAGETSAVPLGAVRADEAGTPVVDVVEAVEDGSTGPAPVTLGLVDGGWVAVEGVPTGTLVRLPG